MPRRSVAAALETKVAIVDRAVAVASTNGLEGVTIGSLAGDLSMSKAGVIGHFGTKEALQLAAIERATDEFVATVWEPVQSVAPGRERLLAICSAWMTWLQRPGGCFLIAASTEFDGRPGAVREAVVRNQRRWDRALAAEARAAGYEDPDQIAFELAAFAAAGNQARQLFGDPEGLDRALRSMRRVLTTPG